jgi:Pirin
MLQLRSKETLDHGDRGWLKARHHVPWNDDEIAPGTGFGRHSHADVEIVTYVRQGVVTHEDSAVAPAPGSAIWSAMTAKTCLSSSKPGCFPVSAAGRLAGTAAASQKRIALGPLSCWRAEIRRMLRPC